MKKSYIVALIAIIGLIGFIASSSGEYIRYSDFATAQQNEDKNYQIVGQLNLDKAWHYDPQTDPNYFAFYMEDQNKMVKKVIYHAPPPQDFDRSEQIVITGKNVGKNFHASEILLKCPSKYIEDKLTMNE